MKVDRYSSKIAFLTVDLILFCMQCNGMPQIKTIFLYQINDKIVKI